MKTTVKIIFEIVSLSLLVGCSPDDRAFEARRDFAIQSARDGLTAFTNVVPTKYNNDNLAALLSLSNGIARTPKVSSAIMVCRGAEKYHLIVFWFENHPSINALELKLHNQGQPVVIPIEESQTKLNEKDAEKTIVFSMEDVWDKTSGLWTDLEGISSTNDLMVRLLRAGAPVTQWHAVDFYKNHAWIANAATIK